MRIGGREVSKQRRGIVGRKGERREKEEGTGVGKGGEETHKGERRGGRGKEEERKWMRGGKGKGGERRERKR